MQITRRDALRGTAALTALAVPVPAFATAHEDAEVIERAAQTLQAWEAFMAVQTPYDEAETAANRGDADAPPREEVARLKARATAAFAAFDVLEEELLDIRAATPEGMLAKFIATTDRDWLRRLLERGEWYGLSDEAVISVILDLNEITGGVEL